VEAHQEAMRLFAAELPAVPLFSRLRLAATTPDVLNFRLDATQPSELWNAFELDMTPGGS
jgi:peptide/nickel transport system substrate-binding protein